MYTIYTGKSIIAQNDWLEIHGTNLATPGTYTTWNDWNWDFTSSLPTTHGSVSATVNGKTAVLYFVSPTQINVLSPLDSSTGSVTVQVNTPYGQTSAMTVTEQQTAPAFLLTYINNDATGVPYVAARHLDATYSLLGPTALSSPGYTFTPAKPGDTVLLYLTGLGQLNPAITDQLKNVGLLLPYTPTVTIGGLSAQVIDATLAAPGLYQFKVVVPASAPNGDLPLLATYNGASTQSSVYITVQK